MKNHAVCKMTLGAIYQSFSVNSRTKTSLNLLNSFLSAACLFQVTIAKLPISSVNIILCLSCLL